MSDSVVIVSGGLDSVTLVYDMVSKGYNPHMLSFNYGQRHKKELQYASITSKHLGLKHDIIDLSGLTSLISNSALTSQTGLTVRGMNFDDKGFHPNIEVPDGHYAEETMKATVVPNRNMMMLSIAGAIAVNEKARCIGIGVHGGDHFIYPDCRPDFLDYTNSALLSGNEDFHQFEITGEYGYDSFASGAGAIYAPYVNKTKADIAYRAFELNVPLHLTWSCYKGGENHCGKCGTCVERLEAISQAFDQWYINDKGIATDSTNYDDVEFWKTTTTKAGN